MCSSMALELEHYLYRTENTAHINSWEKMRHNHFVLEDTMRLVKDECEVAPW